MSWDTLGKRKLNKIQDQPFSLQGWGNSQQDIQLRALQDAGYLRSLKIEVPQLTAAGTLGTGTLALQPDPQLGPLRAIKLFQLSTQAIANLVYLAGHDFYFLRYFSRRRGDPLVDYKFSGAPSAPNGGDSQVGINISESFASPNATLSLSLYLPMTMDIKLRGVATGLSKADGSPLVGSDGKQISAVLDRDLEISLISLQSSELAIQPGITVNPLYSGGPNSFLAATGNATAAATFAGRLNSYMYDVPTLAIDRPNGYQTSLILSRQYVETPVQGGSVEVPFRKAGSLIRAGYVFLDANGNFVDVATTPTATLQFGWGSRVTKINETVEDNLTDCYRRYGGPAPQGLLVHDFFWEHGDLNDVINTRRLASVSCIMNGLPGTVAKVHTIEERIIPVQLRPQGQ